MGKLKRPGVEPTPEPEPTPVETPPAPRETVTKTEAVRRAIAAGYDKPTAGSEWIAREFGLDVSPALFSNLKSQKPKGVLVKRPSAPSPVRRSPSDDTVSVGLALKVRALVREYGQQEVRKAVEFVGEFE